MLLPEYARKVYRAANALKKALRTGQLERPDTCELCGAKPDPMPYHISFEPEEIRYRTAIQAHHWNGYDNPLDIWWTCQTCNLKLRGEENHAGLVSKEEAIRIVTS